MCASAQTAGELQPTMLRHIQRYQKSEYERLNNEAQHQVDPLRTGALQPAILNSQNFSSNALGANGSIHIFTVSADRCLPSLLPFQVEGHENF